MSNATINTNWRKIAALIYGPPKDSKLLGSAELDVTEVEDFIFECRKKGLKITLTHVISLIIGKCIAEEVPEINTYPKRGNIYARDTVDAMISVLMNRDTDMEMLRVKSIDKHNLKSLAEEINSTIADWKSGKSAKQTIKGRELVAKIPWPFRNILLNIIRFFTVTLGMEIKPLGLTNDAYGTFILSNLGSIGLDTGYGALLPGSNLAMAMFLGDNRKKAVVINDEIVIRKMLTMSVVLDHRMIDGKHGGRLFKSLKKRANRAYLDSISGL